MAGISEGSARIIEIIRSIPFGRVMSYGQIAAAAGIPHGARAVVRLLHASSGKYDLPWWRVVRSDGRIALPELSGGYQQRDLLEQEGVIFKGPMTVDMKFQQCY